MLINPQERQRLHALKLIDSLDKPTGLYGLISQATSKAFAAVMGVIQPDFRHVLPDDLTFNPYVDSKGYGCMHYGIMISDLPAPHYFLACASIIGSSGMRTFDIDHAARATGPRQMATICHGTAQTSDDGFHAYVIERDLQTHADGSLVQFGKDVTISGLYPHYRLQSQSGELSVDLKLTATGQITWFAQSTAYNHLSLLTRYEGTITSYGTVQQVSGLCTYEYARGVSPFNLVNKILPFARKLPWDFFTYQVVNLDADTQIVMAHCGVMHYPILTAGYIRTTSGVSRGIQGQVRFQVLSVEDEPAVDADGIHMLRPRTFRWTIEDYDPQYCVQIDATVDTPWLYGLGRGYVGGYQWEGVRGGVPVSGRGYVEYVDVRL